MIKVLIADDHKIVLEGLMLVLEAEDTIEVTHLANDGYEVLNCLEKQLVDIAILDIEMPLIDGIQATMKIREKYPSIKILILSMYNNEEFIKQLIKIGASGYILKNRGREELVKAIRIISEGGEYFGKAVTATLIAALKRPEKKDAQEIAPLTKREKEVLKHIGDGLSSRQISKILYIAPTTVDTHRRNLIDKLGVENSKSLIRYAISNGYSTSE